MAKTAQSEGDAPRGAIEGEQTDESFGLYRAALRAFVARRVRDPHEAEDLVQEACTRLIATVRSRSLDAPQAYLFRIAANLIADRARSRPPMVPLLEEHHPVVEPGQEEARRAADIRAALESALADLPPRARAVFVMRRFDDMDTNAIARTLGISPRMVQKHLTSAVAHLYKRLSGLMEIRHAFP